MPGSLDGANGADGATPPGDPNGQPGGDDLPANADAGYSLPNNDSLNSAMATGGNGGAGGDGMGDGNGGNGGAGGLATAMAASSIVSGPAEADAYSYGGSGGVGGAPGTAGSENGGGMVDPWGLRKRVGSGDRDRRRRRRGTNYFKRLGRVHPATRVPGAPGVLLGPLGRRLNACGDERSADFCCLRDMVAPPTTDPRFSSPRMQRSRETP